MKKIKKIITMFVVFACVLSGFAINTYAADEKEPKEVSPNSSNLSASIAAGDDEVYKITLPHSGLFTFAGFSYGGSSTYFLETEEDYTIVSYTTSYNSSISCYNTKFSHYLDAGTYYLTVRNNQVERATCKTILDYTPVKESFPETLTNRNDHTSEARKIRLNISVKGVLSRYDRLKRGVFADNQDMYTFTLSHKKKITLSTRSYDNNYMEYSLYDSNGSKLFESSETVNTEKGYGSLNKTLTLNAGTYYIKVVPFSNTDEGVYKFTVKADIKVKSVTLNKTALTLSMAGTKKATLTARVLPTNASKRGIEWSSSNTSVAKVSKTGEVTAVAAGTAYIYAKAVDGSGCNAKCKVTVKPAPGVSYSTHVQSYGWQSWKNNGAVSGTSGEAKRLEAIKIKLINKKYAGGIRYTTHVQSYGWLGDPYKSSTWAHDGQMSGTSGQSKRLEAIKIKLYGDMAKKYDIYYRVHAQSYGWLGWAKNGAPSGTAGKAKRLEAIQIVLVKKGGKAPANIYKGVTSNTSIPYID